MNQKYVTAKCSIDIGQATLSLVDFYISDEGTQDDLQRDMQVQILLQVTVHT